MTATAVKGIPRWARYLAIFIILILLVLLVVPYFLDVDRYKSTIASAIQQQTGRTVTIGKIRAKLFPRVGFVIDKFTLGNPPDMAEGSLLSVETIRGGLAWGPLFTGEIQLDSIELVRPMLVLLEDERGRTNYDLSAKKMSPSGGKPAASSSSGFRLADISNMRLTDVDVTLARVTARKRVTTILHATGLNVELGDVALDAARLKQWTADADLSSVRCELAGLRVPLAFRSGDLKLRKGALDAKFEGDVGKVARAKGSIHVADIEQAVAEFELSTAQLDLDQLAAISISTPSAPAVSGKSELVARGRLSADRVRFAPYEATGAKAEVRVFSDRMEIWPVTMALYGGSLGISARVDKRQSPQRFSANIEAHSVDVGKMMASSPSTKGKITGTGELKLQTVGSLGSSLMNSLSGNGNFAVREGRFPGMDLGATMQMLAKMQQVLTLGQSGMPGGATTFRSITGDLSLGGGRVSSNCIHVDSSAGTVDLRGSFGFDQSMKYDGKANLNAGASGGANNPLGAISSVMGGVMKNTVGRIPSFSICCYFSNYNIRPGPPIALSCGGASQTTQQAAPQPQPEEKKKSIFDLFKKP